MKTPLTSPTSPATGTLHVAATPLGNLGDVSDRLRQVLTTADLVLAEDTRRAGQLCQRLGIEANGFMSLYEHNEEGRIKQVIAMLQEGITLALVSDAGTPLMSDPGYRLVRACREEGFRVVPVPGPSAPLAALCASGLPPHPFTFLGFLPRQDAAIRSTLREYGAVRTSIVFFERKSRLAATLQMAFEELGNRECAICRELTKEHEEFIVGVLPDIIPEEELLGEITVILGPPQKNFRSSDEQAQQVLQEESEAGGKPKEISRRAAARLSGWSAKETYAMLSSLRKNE